MEGEKSVSSFFKEYLFIFGNRGREGEREEEKHQLVASCMCPDQGPKPESLACALTGNGTGDLLLCLWDDTQPTELHMSGFKATDPIR